MVALDAVQLPTESVIFRQCPRFPPEYDFPAGATAAISPGREAGKRFARDRRPPFVAMQLLRRPELQPPMPALAAAAGGAGSFRPVPKTECCVRYTAPCPEPLLLPELEEPCAPGGLAQRRGGRAVQPALGRHLSAQFLRARRAAPHAEAVAFHSYTVMQSLNLACVEAHCGRIIRFWR
jgi:hypothetical protein